MSESVAAVILAAGHGSRMGIGKHRLQIGAGTFLQRAVETCVSGGLSPIICVVTPGERDGVAAMVDGAVHVVVNPDADRGMLSSVMEGVRHAGDTRAALVFPVDHPFVSPRTLLDLLRHSADRPGHFIKPVYRGRGGHPVVIPASAFDVILKASASSTLRGVIAGSGISVSRVEVEDSGVLRNINTFEDLHEQ